MVRIGPQGRGGWGAAMALAVSVLAGGACAHAQPARATDDTTARLVQRLHVLAADSMEGRRAGSEGGRRARRWLLAQLTAMGAVPAGDAIEQPVRIAPRGGAATDTAGANLVVRVPGRSPGGPTLVLSAHYDHVGVRDGVVYNGADDNASGTVALLEVLERLRREPPQHDVLLAWFDGEELGLQGARAFVASPPVPLERIALNINLDMVGRQDGGALWVAGTSHTPALRPIADAAVEAASARPGAIAIRFGHDTRDGKPGDDWTSQSDHAAFHARGIPFLYLGVEDHPDYHKPGDDADKIDPAFYRGAVEFIWALVREADRRLGEVPARR